MQIDYPTALKKFGGSGKKWEMSSVVQVGQSIQLVLKQERDFIFLGKILSDTDMVDLMRVIFASPTLLQCQVLCPFTLVHMSQKTSEFDWNYSMDEVDPAEDSIQKNLNKYISSLEAFMTIQV